jgi:5'-AMP-activated protein kinase regulatory gamma subunit
MSEPEDQAMDTTITDTGHNDEAQTSTTATANSIAPTASPPPQAASSSSSSSSSSSASASAAAASSAPLTASGLPPTDLQSRVFHYRSTCLNILAQYQTHHLIPHSGKVVIFDSQLVVKHAFDGMVHHDLSCAPVWDSYKKKYVGLLSVSDFLDILMSTYAAEDKNMFDNLSNARICDWAEYKKQRGTSINRLLCISPEATLHEAVRQLLNYRVHRLCVVQLALADTVLRIITNHGILRFLRNNCPVALSSAISIRELGIGVFNNLLTLTFQTPVIKALELLSAYKVSSIPIVDEHNRPLDVYSRADVRYLALDQTWRNLDMTIEEALSKHRRGRALPLCSRDDSIHTVSGLLVSSMRHSLLCVHADGTIEGVVSLTDIFSFLLNSSAPAAESRIAALKRDYLVYEAAEAAAAAAAAAGGAQADQGDVLGEPGSEMAALRAEEARRQRSYLADHGQHEEMGMTTDENMVLQDLDVPMADESTNAAASDHQRPKDHPAPTASPGILPGPPNDNVPRDMDFLE